VQCFINSEQVQPAEVGYRELGFGQPVPELETHEYRLIFDTPEFVTYLEPEYVEFLKDQRADDRITGDPYPKYFRELGYPDLQELMRHPAEFSDSVQSFFHRDLLGACLAVNGQNVRWVVNSIDQVRVEEGKVVVEGQAYSLP
jgi:hypothetical protein